LDNIPFDIGWKATTQSVYYSDNPTSFMIKELNISRLVEVYILIQGGWAFKIYEGYRIGRIDLSFSTGEVISTELVLGNNIRDWSINDPSAVRTTNSDTI